MNYKLKELILEKAVMRYVDKEDAWFITDKTGFLFPVPLNEIGDAVLHSTEKGITLMKWIKRHIKYVEDARDNQ